MNLKYLKVFFGILLFSFLLVRFDYSLVLETIKLSDTRYIVIGFSLFFISGIFEVYKFLALLSDRFTFSEALSITYSGLFLNNFMPTNIGGDAYRILKLAKKNSYRMASIIVIIDRLNGLALIFLLSLLALYYRPISLSTLNTYFDFDLLVVFLMIILFLIVFFILIVFKYAKEVFNDIKLISMSRYINSIMHSMFFQVSRIVGIYFFVLSVGGSINIIDIAVILSIVLIISLIPISIGALGVREAAFVAGFSIYSIDPVSGLAIAILTRVFLFLQAIVGYFIFSQGE